jgi:hypothetical protein
MKIEIDDLLTLTSAANIRGVSRQNISSLVTRGKLSVIYIDGMPFVKKQDVQAYEPDLGGRPRKEENDKPVKRVSTQKPK